MDKSSVPEGYCRCGCGQKTRPAARDYPQKGWVKGKPLFYLPGHRHPQVSKDTLLEQYLAQEWKYPIGECQCGCGQKTNISTQNQTSNGYVKDKPFRYIRGHQMAFHVRHPELGRLPEGYSYCFDCSSFKPIEQMKPDTQRLGKKRYQCIECALKYLNEYLAKNTDHGRRHHLKKKFKITLEEYDAMSEKQQGLCAICGQPETTPWRDTTRRLAVDHCHETGTIRGLLCMNHNQGLGKFQHDPDLLEKAAKYLRDKLNDDP
jgi:Autographiviridae endonuclease VII